MTPTRSIRPLNSIYTQAEIADARSYVNHVFDNASDRHDTVRENPFTGGIFVPRLDPIATQKEDATRALLARRLFAKIGPQDVDLQPLPLGYEERESLKSGGASHVLAWYARSLEAREYDVKEHPPFIDYARGVMASEHAPDFIKNDTALQKRFPPRPLHGLISGLYWLPPEEYAEEIALTAKRKRHDDD